MRAAALLLLAGACSARSRPALLAELPRPLVFAHRGGAGEGPEATLPTLLAVAERDPETAIELDVRRSRDGQIVVIHDATVDRTTDGTGRVAGLTLAELRALDAGHCATPGRGNGTAPRKTCRTADAGPFPFRGKGYRIPTLDEVLAALPKRTVVGIEVKEAGFEQTLAELLRASGRLERIIVGSADDDVGARLRELLPGAAHYFPEGAAIRLALSAKLAWGAFSRPDYHVLAVPPSGGGLDLQTRGVIEAAHRRDVLVAYWTVNDAAQIERLFRLGADGVFTDYPARARQVVDGLRRDGALRR